jgi:transposase
LKTLYLEYFSGPKRAMIAQSLFYKWKEQFIEGGKKALNGNNKEYKDETSDLKRIIAELTIANDALKKTLKIR